MKANKLPSGSWRVQVYLGKDAAGKPIRKSVTGKTRQEALRKAALLDPEDSCNKTVAEAAKEYIEIKEPVISPSTHKGYLKIYRNWIENDPIGCVRMDKLTGPLIQRWVSGMASKSSPKSVRNNYGFLTAVIGMYLPNVRFRGVTLPQKKPAQLHLPTADELNKALAFADPQLRLAILLGAAGMMRRGEIAALTADDVDFRRGIVFVNKSMVETSTGGWTIKQPKTTSSIRSFRLNMEYIEMMPREGSIVGLNPDQITLRFSRVLKKAGLPPFRFHDLRHYATSAADSSDVRAGVKTIQARGGWSNTITPRGIYDHSMKEQEERDTDRILAFNARTIRLPKV